ncbi:Alpha/Beta hydrolase protein [Dichotomopilus funicola]|uniref:Carboxypeptidase n=1 Tax=Dichotomopilus funicola TaxID=1934379 RepID=A0AAN6ZQK2_9PEZI|nr:Alpha/Beta hydrolase protein [Dichotomopilus funicola]
MRWTTFLSALLLSGTADAAGRSIAHAGKRHVEHAAKRARSMVGADFQPPVVERDEKAEHKFLNANTTKFAVDGKGIPDVDFDVGESYAGLLPITSKKDEESNLFFWFFPSTNEAADKEIIIWLNGGPGCSSFEGLLQENGPFLWQYGTYKPVKNPWSWHTLSNIIYVEQPVGTGFSTGKPSITNEEELADQFKGFWKNFVDTFGLHGYKVYIAGESYAGYYCPYIAHSFVEDEDKTYFDLAGMTIYNPSLTFDEVQEPIPAVAFTEYWAGLFPFNDTFRADLKRREQECGYADFLAEYLVYPPKGPMPNRLPGTDKTGTTRDECWNIYWDIFDAISLLNPCFDIYQVATTCPLLWDVLGFPGSMPYLPEGTDVYFDRADVKKAIHAPEGVTWEECSSDDVFVGGSDGSLPSTLSVLPRVIDATKNVIVGHSALDMILLANGTLLSFQNMTWGGKLGFQNRPDQPFYVPHNNITGLSTLAGAGVFGSLVSERGLTFVGVDLAGHMVPQYAPSAAYRHVEFMLGRVDCMNCTKPFTTDPQTPQSDGDLGFGTAPPGWSGIDGGKGKGKGKPPRRIRK